MVAVEGRLGDGEVRRAVVAVDGTPHGRRPGDARGTVPADSLVAVERAVVDRQVLGGGQGRKCALFAGDGPAGTPEIGPPALGLVASERGLGNREHRDGGGDQDIIRGVENRPAQGGHARGRGQVADEVTVRHVGGRAGRVLDAAAPSTELLPTGDAADEFALVHHQCRADSVVEDPLCRRCRSPRWSGR